MKGKPTHPRVELNNRSGAVRTIAQVRDEYERRTGVRLTTQRVWQIVNAAEKKLRKGLANVAAA